MIPCHTTSIGSMIFFECIHMTDSLVERLTQKGQVGREKIPSASLVWTPHGHGLPLKV